MTERDEARRVEITDEGRLVAAADVTRLDPETVSASLHVEPRDVPSEAKGRLVDAVADTAEVSEGGRLRAGVPRGDAELIERVRERFDDVETRSAGASVIVEGSSPRPPSTP